MPSSSCFARFFRGAFVDHAFLKPDRWNLQPDRLLHNFIDILGPPEDIYEIDFFGNVKQRRIGFFAQRFGDEPAQPA